MYEIFEHTADLGLRIRAATREQLLVDAARGLYGVIVANLDQVQAVEQRQLRVEGTDPEYLLFDWLSELLYLFESERLLLCQFDVDLDEQGLRAECRGELMNLTRHVMDHEVKAITYHGLSVGHDGQQWVAEVIVDI